MEGMKRFEEIAEIYIHGSKEVQATILSFLTEEEKKIFLQGAGLYHLFTDGDFYKHACAAVCHQVWEDAHRATV